ncbi:MAG: bifunctional DNA-formamidopyrimidine glycosylase/DNA-(apurinic or apyrimidinic site) lyase [Candidatus Saccharimonadaceae bacterium]|nr:bifunctional DNA-formamidopyrimidine glycosylase/DNA-(apurinic or apyrimidinic site) lyase [Candidatus Saccharimonadaceae bacterium]
MPELPEVETVRRGLHKLIIGKIIKIVSSDNQKSFPNASADVEEFLIGSKVTDVRRRAKVLMIDLSTDHTLVVHLKMTGQLVFVSKHKRFGAGHPTDSLVHSLPDKSTRVIVEFNDGSNLYFNDQRKFGWVRLMPTPEVPNIDFMKRVGPEPLEADFTLKQFVECFKRRPNTSIKAALLDQSVIAGVGNIYADESLWGAKIHPKRLVKTLTKTEFRRLFDEVRYVMNLSIEKGGSTNRNYVDAEGKKGSYMDFARVFRREGLECPRCGTEILKIKVAGRGTHICPKCQKNIANDRARDILANW